MVMFLRSVLLMLVVTLLWGCRKELDTQAPEVTILLPSSTYTGQVPDTLMVRVAITDDQQVNSVVITLQAANGAVIAPSLTLAVGSSSATVEGALIVSDERITSGSYTLIARATDGRNDGRDFVSLTLQAAPLRTRSVFIGPPAGTTPATLYRIDSLGTLTTWLTLPELGGAAVLEPVIYTAGTVSAPFERWNANTGASSVLTPNNTPAGSSLPFFNGTVRDPFDDRIYVGRSDGTIVGFSAAGTQVFNGTSIAGSRSMLTAALADRLMSAALDQVTQEWTLVSHAYVSGNALEQRPLDHAPIALFRTASDRVLSIGQRGTDAVVQTNYLTQGGSFDHLVFAGTEVFAVAQLSEQEYFLALSSGVARVRTTDNSYTYLAPGMVAGALAHGPANGSVYVGQGQQVLRLDANTGSIVEQWSVPAPVGVILPLLNR